MAELLSTLKTDAHHTSGRVRTVQPVGDMQQCKAEAVSAVEAETYLTTVACPNNAPICDVQQHKGMAASAFNPCKCSHLESILHHHL